MNEVRKRNPRVKLAPQAYKNLLHQVLIRDGWRCRIPGCGRRNGLHGHHVVFRSQGGNDSTTNLLTVCNTCHDLIHAHKLIVEGVDGVIDCDKQDLVYRRT
jgi:5-methylcytosine-specific restriction endonuclease McrA